MFDVYFPAGYPEKPPMVNLDTTGGGRVRFNPNLYADGKVCLSLLGTWHGGGAEEKWDAKNSSLYQVLVSIQGLILVDDPMFNEPGFDGIRGTTEGDLKSREHNEEIRLYTVRHAMIAHLKKPRPGVGTVTDGALQVEKVDGDEGGAVVVRGGERSDGAEANVGRGEGALATPGGPLRSERRRANDDLLDTRESINET